MEKLLKLFGEVDHLAECHEYLDILASCRDERFPAFAMGDGRNTSGESTALFENSVVEDEAAGSPDIEIERLRAQERALKDDIERLKNTINAEKKRADAEIERCNNKAQECKKKIEKNKAKSKEMRSKQASIKGEIKNVTMMSKEVVDKIDFPRKILSKFLKAGSEDGLCTDGDICKEFGSGKCLESQSLNLEDSQVP